MDFVGGAAETTAQSTRTTDAFYQFLLRKLQAIPEIQSTESFICLAQPIDRDLPLAELEGE